LAIEKAIKKRLTEINKRSNKNIKFDEDINNLIDHLTSQYKIRTQAQLQSHQLKFQKSINPRMDESTIIESILNKFEETWNNINNRLAIIPGKDFLSSLNEFLQTKYKMSITQANIINSIDSNLVPS